MTLQESRFPSFSDQNEPLKIESTHIPGLLVLTPNVYYDDRGYFFESYSAKKMDAVGKISWVQDNESMSVKGVLRGLHYQTGSMAQAKLVRAVKGEIFDVVVDIRPLSPTYRQWFGLILDEKKKQQLFIPHGLAHGFLVLSSSAVFAYKCDNFYSSDHEGGIYYDDPSLSIEWPMSRKDIIISEKDLNLPMFGQHKRPE